MPKKDAPDVTPVDVLSRMNVNRRHIEKFRPGGNLNRAARKMRQDRMKATPDIDQMLNITTHSRSKGTESDTLIIRAVPSVPSNARVERPRASGGSATRAQNKLSRSRRDS